MHITRLKMGLTCSKDTLYVIIDVKCIKSKVRFIRKNVHTSKTGENNEGNQKRRIIEALLKKKCGAAQYHGRVIKQLLTIHVDDFV